MFPMANAVDMKWENIQVRTVVVTVRTCMWRGQRIERVEMDNKELSIPFFHISLMVPICTLTMSKRHGLNQPKKNNARSMIMIPSHCPRSFSSAAKMTILQCTLSNESADTVHTSNLSCIAPMCPTRCTPSIDALGPTKQPSPHFCSPPTPDLGHSMARSSLL